MRTETQSFAHQTRSRIGRAAGIIGVCGLTACAGAQSALDPGGPVARALAETWWVLLIGAAVILALVMALALYAVFRAPGKRAEIRDTTFIVGGGLIFPIVTLTLLLLYTVHVGERVRAMPADALRIEVVGHQWWWEVRYPAHDAVTANEIHLPAGRPVLVEVTSADVIHSFWVPSLAGKIDMLPEQRNRVWLQADAPGVYRGQCSEFCGAQHARMSLLVIAQPPADFDRWLAAQRRPAATPETESQARGRVAFLSSDCVDCHTVRGLDIGQPGKPAPDLTHVGSRRMLGAATVANTPENLRAWIENSQAIKPGNRMPPFTDIEPAMLDDIAAFLESLE